MRSEFLIALMTMEHLLRVTKATSIAIQGPSLELPQSMNHIETCVNSFNWRNDEGGGSYKKVHSDTANVGDVHIEARRCRPPKASLAFDHFR